MALKAVVGPCTTGTSIIVKLNNLSKLVVKDSHLRLPCSHMSGEKPNSTYFLCVFIANL
jgi:hypothetical protein